MMETIDAAIRRRANRVVLTFAGRRLRAYSIAEHVGRSSGRTYRNPVSAFPLGDGFVVAELYGPQSQWVKNALANGGYTLHTHGTAHRLDRPEIIGADRAIAAYPLHFRLMLRARGIDRYVWAHRTGTT